MPQFWPADKYLDLQSPLVQEDWNQEGECVIDVIHHPQVRGANLEEEVVSSCGPLEDDQVAPRDLQDTL